MGTGRGNVRFTQSSTCLISSFVYCRSSSTCCEFEFRKVGFGALPASIGMVQLPCWMPAVRLPSSAYYSPVSVEQEWLET